jgi:hypothetical protein
MNRHEWIFKYTASKLATAAETKCNHHKERLAWWKQQKEAVMVEVKESGIEVNESLAAAYTKNTGMGPQVMVRNDLQQKLTECHMKLKEHDQKASEYDGWVQVLTANPEAQLELHHDDWLYFFAR